MSFYFFLLVIIILGLGSYYFGRSKALALKQNDVIHSLPKYYGYYALVWFATPALIIVSLWLIFSEGIVTNQVINTLPDNIKTLPTNELTLILNDIKNKAAGNLVAGESFAGFELVAERYNSYSEIAKNIIIYSSIVLGLISFVYAYDFSRCCEFGQARAPFGPAPSRRLRRDRRWKPKVLPKTL